jgi:two-component system sensor histidine kinase/response regulator
MRMPVMDGLAATRAIRARERERGIALIPIVALTANASLQDMENSRDAGCNAHLSKPISKSELLSSIEKYRRQMKPMDTPLVGSVEPIRIEMDPDLEDIVPGYLAARREELPRMIALLAVSDFTNLAILGHNLKGTGTSYGFPDLTRIGIALEGSAKRPDRAALSTELAELKEYLSRVELFAEVHHPGSQSCTREGSHMLAGRHLPDASAHMGTILGEA